MRQDKIIRMAVMGITAPGFETEPGMCLRWVRQVVESTDGPGAWPCPRGMDAKQCIEWIEKRRRDLIVTNGSVPGDILFMRGSGHGEHGHVAIRVPKNMVAENSSVHWNVHNQDARGYRVIGTLDGMITIVRLWS